MGKPSTSIEPVPLTREELHQLYIAGNNANDISLWRQSCEAYLGEYPANKSQITYYPRLLCTDADDVKCKEFGHLAALLVHRNQWSYLSYLTGEIQSVEQERQRRMTFGFFTENEVKDDPAFLVGLWKALIPYARLEDLEAMFSYANALHAMWTVLNKIPEHCEDLSVKASRFYDLDSPSAQIMMPEQKSMIEQNNTRLWYRQPLNTRIAAACGHQQIWQVGKVDLERLNETIKDKCHSLEARFSDGLAQARKPINVENEMDGEENDQDDEVTLVDVRC